jgi:hypothetical protein
MRKAPIGYGKFYRLLIIKLCFVRENLQAWIKQRDYFENYLLSSRDLTGRLPMQESKK